VLTGKTAKSLDQSSDQRERVLDASQSSLAQNGKNSESMLYLSGRSGAAGGAVAPIGRWSCRPVPSKAGRSAQSSRRRISTLRRPLLEMPRTSHTCFASCS